VAVGHRVADNNTKRASEGNDGNDHGSNDLVKLSAEDGNTGSETIDDLVTDTGTEEGPEGSRLSAIGTKSEAVEEAVNADGESRDERINIALACAAGGVDGLMDLLVVVEDLGGDRLCRLGDAVEGHEGRSGGSGRVVDRGGGDHDTGLDVSVAVVAVSLASDTIADDLFSRTLGAAVLDYAGLSVGTLVLVLMGVAVRVEVDLLGLLDAEAVRVAVAVLDVTTLVEEGSYNSFGAHKEQDSKARAEFSPGKCVAMSFVDLFSQDRHGCTGSRHDFVQSLLAELHTRFENDGLDVGSIVTHGHSGIHNDFFFMTSKVFFPDLARFGEHVQETNTEHSASRDAGSQSDRELGLLKALKKPRK